MSTFEEQLSQQLREAARNLGRPRRRPWPGRQMVMASAVAAAAASLAVGTLVIGSIGGLPNEHEALPGAAPAGHISLFDQPLSDADRALQARIRRADQTDPFAYPRKGFGPVSKMRVGAQLGDTTIIIGALNAGDGVCSITIGPEGYGGGCRERWATGLNPQDSPFTEERQFVFGLMYDGVSQVTAVFRDGTVLSYPVEDNRVVIPHHETLPYETLEGIRYTVNGKTAYVPLDYGDVQLARAEAPRGSAIVRVGRRSWLLTISSRAFHEIGPGAMLWLTGGSEPDVQLRRTGGVALNRQQFFKAPADPHAFETIEVRAKNGHVLYSSPVPPRPVKPPAP